MWVSSPMTVVGSLFRPTTRGSSSVVGSIPRTSLLGFPQRLLQDRQQLLPAQPERLCFVLQRPHLLHRKLAILQIAHQPLRASGDMPDMKSG